MEKRYQVFVSSTFSDLQEERWEVIKALLELDCIPSGMELFPAADDDQWTLIKRLIDDCDYYVVVIGGRYGSLGPNGLSYTQMEYQYAVDARKPVLAFIHKNPGSIPSAKSEISNEGRAKLDTFRDLVQKRMCKFWETPYELGSVVSRSLFQLMKTKPATGWIRADTPPDGKSAEIILNLKLRIEELEGQLDRVRTSAPVGTEDFAQGEDPCKIHYTYVPRFGSNKPVNWRSTAITTWKLVFKAIGLSLLRVEPESTIRHDLNSFIENTEFDKCWDIQSKKNGLNSLGAFAVTDSSFQEIKIQLMALGLIAQTDSNGSFNNHVPEWTLTPHGRFELIKQGAIKKDESIMLRRDSTPDVFDDSDDIDNSSFDNLFE